MGRAPLSWADQRRSALAQPRWRQRRRLNRDGGARAVEQPALEAEITPGQVPWETDHVQYGAHGRLGGKTAPNPVAAEGTDSGYLRLRPGGWA